MPAFRFIHTADIHLDSPLRSLALKDESLAELIGNATRRAFSGVIDLCLAERVDALMIAGDLYDGDQTSMKTALFLAAEFRRLSDVGIQVFVIRGNHDAASRITRELTLPENVKVFAGRAEVVMANRPADALPIAVHGLSFAEPKAPESLVGKFKPPVAGAFDIALLHTSLNGAAGHDPYAPCSLRDLQVTGHRYWGLGHIHRRAVHDDGRALVVMPGMPQGRDIGEDGAKSVTLVTVGEDGSVQAEERHTSIAEFRRIEVDITGLPEWGDAVLAIQEGLAAARHATRSPELVARLKLTGASALAWRLRRDRDLIQTEAVNCAAAVGHVWVEALEIGCRPPDMGAATSGDPLEELRQLARDEVVREPDFVARITALVDELRRQLPPDERGPFGNDEAELAALVDAAIGEGVDDVLAALQAGDSGPADR